MIIFTIFPDVLNLIMAFCTSLVTGSPCCLKLFVSGSDLSEVSYSIWWPLEGHYFFSCYSLKCWPDLEMGYTESLSEDYH